MDNNWRAAIGYICIALVFIGWFAMMAWIGSPRDFTFKIEMDNNTKEAIESIEYPIIEINSTNDEYEFICGEDENPLWNNGEGCYFQLKNDSVGGISE